MTKTKTKKAKRVSSKPTLAVWRRNFRNQKIVEAELDTGEIQIVIVRDSGLYCDGMTFEVYTDGSNYYERKVPRQRGKV